MERKFYRRMCAALCCVAAIAMLGCKDKDKPVGPDPTAKPVTGVDPVFSEPIGFNNEDPCVFAEDGARYVYFTRNSLSGGGTDTIAARKGVYGDGAWTYGGLETLLEPRAEGWDSKRVYAPSVIKGDFTYDGEAYGYLMAYAGTDNPNARENANAQIGLAVAKAPLGPFTRVGDAPAVTYRSEDWSPQGQVHRAGATNPSLVSFDRESKVFLFYTLFANLVADTARFLELDLSADLKTLGQVPAAYGSAVAVAGAEPINGSALLGADWAYAREDGAEYGSFFAASDVYPAAATRPRLPSAVALYRADEYKALYEVTEPNAAVWEALGTVNFRSTAVFEDETRITGYPRIFSAGIARDAYGWTTGSSVELFFSSSPTIDTAPETYAYSRAIHAVTLEVE